jgi:hypothetical protein
MTSHTLASKIYLNGQSDTVRGADVVLTGKGVNFVMENDSDKPNFPGPESPLEYLEEK